VFDERVQTLFDRAEGIGMPLQRYVDEGLVMVRQVDPAELTAGEFSHAARTLVEADGIQMLIIDSLNGYAYAMPDERMLSVHLHEMSSYLNQQAVTAVFTVTQHGLVFGQAEQPFDLSYLTDTVILFRHFEFAGRIRKAISGYKCRSGAHESDIRELLITSGGVRVGPPLKKFQGILTGAPHYLGDSVDDLHGDH
jgi:circadian clock protein KaiC